MTIPAPPLRHTLRFAAVALAALLLSACAAGSGRTQSGLIKRINPPSASIEGLAAASPGAVRLSVRLQNFSTIPTRYGRVDAALAIDGAAAGRLTFDAGIEIPGLSSDVVPAEVVLYPDARARLDAAAADRRAVAYRLEGTIATTDPEDTWKFTFDSRLNPVPGRPGEFR
jgi:hypothetical protein